MAAEEVHLTDPGEMQLPVVGPGAPRDGAARVLEQAVLEVGARQALQRRLARDVGQVEDEAAGLRLEELPEEAPLVDALVPGAQVLGVEVDVELAELGQGRQAAAEVLPGVVLCGDGDACDVGLGLAVRAWEVELCYQGLHAEADLDVAHVPGGSVHGEEVSCHDEIGETEGQGFLEGPDALDVPGVVLIMGLKFEEEGVASSMGKNMGSQHTTACRPKGAREAMRS